MAPASSTWSCPRPELVTLCPSLAATRTVTSVRSQPAALGAGTMVEAVAGATRSVRGTFWSDAARSRIFSQEEGAASLL